MSIETSKLPDKPSDLIHVALHDLKLAEESEKYEIDMGTWHTGFEEIENEEGVLEEEPCQVCFAGAVMAFSLEGVINRQYKPNKFPEEEGKLSSLNTFRLGEIHRGLREFYGKFYGDTSFDLNTVEMEWEIPYYHKDKEGFHQAMAEMADYLKEKGY